MKPSEVVLSVILTLGLFATPVPSPGQQPAKVYRIGFLNISAAGYETDPHHCFLPGKGTPNPNPKIIQAANACATRS